MVLLCAICLPVFASDLDKFLGKTITRVDIVVEGAPGGETTEMRDVVSVRKGASFSEVEIHDSLYRLYRSGLVSAARVEAEAAGADGVIVRFIVKPQARIDTVVFQGDTIFAQPELRAHLNGLDNGEKLTPGLVSRGVGELQSYYANHGYYQAQVSSDVRLDQSGTRATVIFSLTPGAPAKVSELDIEAKGAKVDISKVNQPLSEGKVFTDTALQDEMTQIRQTYLQNNYMAVQISSALAPDASNNTVAVTVKVESGPLVSIEINGLKITDKQKRQTLTFYTQGGLDEFSLEDGRRRLLDFAQRQGYFFAEVGEPERPDLTKSEVQIVYDVSPGGRYKLSDISIKGVNAVRASDLIAELKSKQASLISFGTPRRGITSNDYLRDDSNHIAKRLHDLGYRRVRVEALKGVSPHGEDLIITFDVRQGPRTYVDEVGIKGNVVLTADRLSQLVTIKPGDPLVASVVNSNSDHILTAYNQLGYSDVTASPELVDEGNLDGEDRVKLLYGITEGSRVKILHITTNGTAHSDPKRLQKDFYVFKVGDWLNNDKLQETERVLYDTNAFASVTVHSEPVGRTPSGVVERDVTVDLAEAKRFLLIYGFGFQTTNGNPTVPGLGFLHGLQGLVQLTDTDLLGKLYTGSIQFRVSPVEALGQISFENPRPFGYNFPVIFSIFAQRLAEQSFSTDRYTAQVQFEKRLSPNSILYFSYNFERIIVFDLQLSSILEIERNSQPVTLGRIGPSFLRDTRDNASEPRKGTLTSASLSLASTLLGGNARFIKVLVGHDRYYAIPHLKDVTYSISGRLGLATPYGGKVDIPISERFFAGGARDLRGFGFELAGPLDPGTGLPLGGNALLVLNNELRFPIYGAIGGAVFSDTGNVFARVRDIKPGNLTESLGYGLRVKTPVGPLRLDMGFLVFNRPPGQPLYRLHLSLGQTF